VATAGHDGRPKPGLPGNYETGEDGREAEAFFDAEFPSKTGGGKRYPSVGQEWLAAGSAKQNQRQVA
jgi:hypothetical protein